MDDKQQSPAEETAQTAQADIHTATDTTSESKMERILSLENMINGYLVDLDKLQKDLKEQSGMLKGVYEQDAEYAGIVEKEQDVKKLKATVKDRLMKDPAVALLEEKVTDLKGEVKDVRYALSQYLAQYYQESGLTQITGSDGEVRELVTTVKLVKKRE